MEKALHAGSPAALPWMRPLGLLAMGYVALAGADSRTQLFVGAVVQPVARIEVLAAPSAFAVSAADLQRGYVVAPEPVRLRVYSNSRTGFALDLRNLAPDMRAIEVRGLGADVTMAGEGASIVQRWDAPQTRSLELRFRFALPQGLAPGTYPWPVQLHVSPLAAP
jgi:hypothetical protein